MYYPRKFKSSISWQIICKSGSLMISAILTVTINHPQLSRYWWPWSGICKSLVPGLLNPWTCVSFVMDVLNLLPAWWMWNFYPKLPYGSVLESFSFFFRLPAFCQTDNTFLFLFHQDMVFTADSTVWFSSKFILRIHIVQSESQF